MRTYSASLSQLLSGNQTCRVCGRRRHFAAVCRSRTTQQSPLTFKYEWGRRPRAADTRGGLNNRTAIISQSIVNSNFIVVKIGNKYVRALLDTGSSSTVVSGRFTRQHHLRQISLGTSKPSLISANCTPLDVISRVEFSINISGLTVPISAVVIRQASHDFILGTDFLQNNQVIVDYNRGLVSVAEDTVRTPCSKRLDFATCIESSLLG